MTEYRDTGTKGAAAELRVAADLLARGYQVFRNVAPHGVDLVAYDEHTGALLKVEVRSHVNRTLEGMVQIPPSLEEKDRDVFGFALPNEPVFYHPWGIVHQRMGAL